MDHLFTFANLRQLGLLVEQHPGETLTVMESKVGKLVNDRAAGDNQELFSHDPSHQRCISSLFFFPQES